MRDDGNGRTSRARVHVRATTPKKARAALQASADRDLPGTSLQWRNHTFSFYDAADFEGKKYLIEPKASLTREKEGEEKVKVDIDLTTADRDYNVPADEDGN